MFSTTRKRLTVKVRLELFQYAWYCSIRLRDTNDRAKDDYE